MFFYTLYLEIIYFLYLILKTIHTIQAILVERKIGTPKGTQGYTVYSVKSSAVFSRRE